MNINKVNSSFLTKINLFKGGNQLLKNNIKMNIIMSISTNKTLMLVIKGFIILQNINSNAQRY